MLLHQAGTFRLQIGNLVVNIIDFLLDMGLTMQAKNFLQVYKTVRKLKN